MFQTFSKYWDSAVNKDKNPCPSGGDILEGERDNKANGKCPIVYEKLESARHVEGVCNFTLDIQKRPQRR